MGSVQTMATNGQGDGPGPRIAEEVARLYSANAAGLLRYGLGVARAKEAAQDALQEAFMRYFTARAAGQRIRRPKAWLYRVLRNQLLDQRKASEGRSEIGLDGAWNSPDGQPGPELLYWKAELARSLESVLAPRELECIRLRAEGLRYDEVADILGIRSGTVGALLTRAHKKYRKIAGFRPAGAGTRGSFSLNSAKEEPYAP